MSIQTPFVPDASFKDATPQDTIQRIKNILTDHGIETQVRWNNTQVPFCYSVRVNVAGTTFGTNGKGVTEEFALASGYGELMERLQLGYIFRHDQQKGENVAMDEGQGRCISATELLGRNRKWYSLYAAELQQNAGITMTEEALLAQYADDQGQVEVTPYYCVTTDCVEYIPTKLRKTVYATNGCAAGNTMEEAMVQAISEIVERNYKCRILRDHISVPDIPDEVLRTFPIVWQIISFLRENGLKVNVKDCSLGTQFPVVCVCLIDTRTGKYHTHFGAFPNLEIALQRTLTESFQGRALTSVGQHAAFSARNEGFSEMGNLMNELVKGTAEKSPSFFMSGSDLPFNANVGFGATSNRDRLRRCLDFFAQQGFDVLVRDSSCLGFPTCQVVIPGYSEVFFHRLSTKNDDGRYYKHAKAVMRNPAQASPTDMVGLMMHLSLTGERKLGRRLFATDAGLAIDVTPQEDAYLLNMTMAYVDYANGKKDSALAAVSKSLDMAPAEDLEYLICLKRYFELGKDGYSQQQVKQILEHFHRPETVKKLYGYLDRGANPLDSVVLHCDLKCGEGCRMFRCCTQAATDKLATLINTRNSVMDQSHLGELIRNVMN